MTGELTPAPERPPARVPILDLGAGDPEAPANAIPAPPAVALRSGQPVRLLPSPGPAAVACAACFRKT